MMPPNLQIHTAIEQALSRLIYKREGELEAIRHEILEKINNKPPPILSSPPQSPRSINNNNSSNNNTSTATTAATVASERLLQDQENQEEVERQHQERNALRSSLLSTTNPCITSPVFWWTHRALKSTPVGETSTTTIHSATIERECCQLVALCFHILSHNLHKNTSEGDDESKDDKSNTKTTKNLVSILCGNPDLFVALKKKIQTTSGFLANQLALGTIEILLVNEETSKKMNDSNNSSSLCRIFAFGFFPSKEAGVKLFGFNSLIGTHLSKSTTFSFIVGHYLWPDCDSPLRSVVEKAATILKQEPVSVTNYRDGTIQKMNVDEQHAFAFSSCLLIRCSRHPEQIAVLTSEMTLNEMRTQMRCDRLCRLPLRCGVENHLCTERCHSLVEHEATPCPFPCTKKTPGCDHPCRRLCGETPCDCLRTTTRDLDCSHVTLKGHRLHHRFEGACSQAHNPCKVSIPVRCSHCYGVSFVPCCEAQDELAILNENSANNNSDSTSTSTDLPEMPPSFKCKDCQDVEYKIRSQIKLDLAKEEAARQKETQREQLKTSADQQRAASRGIFVPGSQVLINDISEINDTEVASALFPDVEEHKWAKIVDSEDDVLQSLQDTSTSSSAHTKASFENAIGVISLKPYIDPFDSTRILYVLSVPTHGGYVAVNDKGLKLFRGVETGGDVGGNALLMIEAKKDPVSNKGKDSDKPLQERFPLGTRVVVVDGHVTSESNKHFTKDVLFALDHSAFHNKAESKLTSRKPSSEDMTVTMDEDDADEIYVDQHSKTEDASASSSSSSLKISNVIGTVSRVILPSKESDAEAKSSEVYNTDDEDEGKVVVSIEINVVHPHSSQQKSESGQRRDRDGESTTNENNTDQDKQEQEQELITFDLECSPSSIVPLFRSGSTVTVREPSRHVTDAKERSHFGISPHHIVGLPQLQEFVTTHKNQLPFSKKFLADKTRCVVQGFVNAPKATPLALQRDTTLRSALRRGPCYIVSIISEHRRFQDLLASSTTSTPPMPRLFLVPLFFVDLDINEIVDKNVASKIEAELDSRTHEKMEEYLNEKFISNQEVAQKRKEEIAEERKREAKANQNSKKTTTDGAPPQQTESTSTAEADQQQHQQQHHQYATVRLQVFTNKQEEIQATQKFMTAKKFALASYKTLLERDAALSGPTASGMVSLGAVRMLSEEFEKQYTIDQSARNGMKRLLS